MTDTVRSPRNPGKDFLTKEEFAHVAEQLWANDQLLLNYLKGVDAKCETMMTAMRERGILPEPLPSASNGSPDVSDTTPSGDSNSDSTNESLMPSDQP